MDEQQLSDARQQAFSGATRSLATCASGSDPRWHRLTLSQALHRECEALGILPGRERGLVVTWGLAQFGLGS